MAEHTNLEWRVILVTAAWQFLFQHEFKTTKEGWTEVFIPFDKLKASFRGWNLPGMKFNSKSIQRVGLIIADKKEGPFELNVDWIKAI